MNITEEYARKIYPTRNELFNEMIVNHFGREIFEPTITLDEDYIKDRYKEHTSDKSKLGLPELRKTSFQLIHPDKHPMLRDWEGFNLSVKNCRITDFRSTNNKR